MKSFSNKDLVVSKVVFDQAKLTAKKRTFILIVELSLSDGETRILKKKNYRHWQAHLSTLQLKVEWFILTGCSESNGTYCLVFCLTFFHYK